MRSTAATASATARPLPGCIAIAAMLLAAMPDARSHPTEVVITRPHASGHVGAGADQSWPPQPRGITSVVNRVAAVQGDSRGAGAQRGFGEVEQRVRGRSDVSAALGEQFTRISQTDMHDKGGGRPTSRLTYFSRSSNTTVEMVSDGVDLLSLKSVPAAQYQPEIVDEESAEAIALARAHFMNLGRSRAAGLKGYAILAYRPDGKGFYDSRVLYVSFHARADAPPQFSAWVDLSSQSILKIREERP